MHPSTRLCHRRFGATSTDRFDNARHDLVGTVEVGAPVGAVVFRIDQRLSLYANYIEGLVQGDTAPDTYTDSSGATRNVANAGAVFKPF